MPPDSVANTGLFDERSPLIDTSTLVDTSHTSQQPSATSKVSKTRGVTVIVTLAGVSFLNTMGSGILIAALPRIASDLDIAEGLILWPAAVYALAAGCLLLIFGAVADVVGAKLMWVTGSFAYAAFTVAIGLSRTGLQIILFRTCLGVAIAMCLPTAVGLIAATFPKGAWRNTAFAMNGMGQPLGYAVGLVLGGVFTDSIGWRWAYYIMALINVLLSIASIWSLPARHCRTDKKWTRRLVEEIDWIGAVIMSAGLGLLLYVLAMISSSHSSIRHPANATLLSASIVLLVLFPFWMHRQTQRGRPAIIPNKLWRNSAFTSICVSVFFCWAAMNGIEYYTTLYFQNIEGLSALESSIRFIPHPIVGTATNIVTAYLVSRVRVQTLAVVSSVVTLSAPVLMATIRVGESYWFAPFWALVLSPISPDVLFTVSNIVISEAFPDDVQSLAGGVFNEISQIGNSVGLAITAAVAASVTAQEPPTEDRTGALMEGYRMSLWTIFAATVIVLLVTSTGLRKAGTIGKAEGK